MPRHTHFHGTRRVYPPRNLPSAAVFAREWRRLRAEKFDRCEPGPAPRPVPKAQPGHHTSKPKPRRDPIQIVREGAADAAEHYEARREAVRIDRKREQARAACKARKRIVARERQASGVERQESKPKVEPAPVRVKTARVT